MVTCVMVTLVLKLGVTWTSHELRVLERCCDVMGEGGSGLFCVYMLQKKILFNLSILRNIT